MSFLSKLLEYYHLTLKDLDSRKELGSFCCLKRPECPSFIALCDRLAKAIKNKEKTVIYGDYDVDGISATAILKIALDELGINPGFFIPSRYHEGYGLNAGRVEEFHQKGYHLIIAVDNGVSSSLAIHKAKELGMDVLVIDHHEIPRELPEYDFLFHPMDFLDYNCSAASLCYFVANRLLARDDEYLAFLAGLSAFSDVMPLIGNNLVFAKMILPLLQKNRFLNFMPFFSASEINYEDINFRIIPSLNAPGRILTDSLSPNQVCRFLLERSDIVKIRKLHQFLNDTNVKRKSLVQYASFDDRMTLSSAHAMVLKSDCLSGLSGLLANRLMKQNDKCICVCIQSDLKSDELVLSFRVPDGYNLDSFFLKYGYLFLSHGGHAKAAGGTILVSKYFQMATMFISECEKMSLEMKKEERKSIDIVMDDLTYANYQIYQQFMPFGEGFPKPLFHISFNPEELKFSTSGKMAYVSNRDVTSRIVFFDKINELRNCKDEILASEGYLQISDFNSRRTIEIVAENICKNNS